MALPWTCWGAHSTPKATSCKGWLLCDHVLSKAQECPFKIILMLPLISRIGPDCTICKRSSISILFYQAMQAIAMVILYENKLLQYDFKQIQHYIYLFKLYSISIFLLLENNSTNICSKISKIGINLWML